MEIGELKQTNLIFHKMKKKLYTLLLVITFFAKFSLAQTTIRVPADQPTIQAGIDAASNGDTVLVSPGTYVENINFNGKNIIVGSFTLTSGDTTYVSQTIIDGNHNGSVVTFNNGESQTAVLYGFTLINGDGTANSTNNDGGGLYISSASPTIYYCNVVDNHAERGAGIFISNSKSLLADLKIIGNIASSHGGGCYIESSNIAVYNSLFYSNLGPLSALGSGLALFSCSSDIINCTFVEHEHVVIMCYQDAKVNIKNSIFWNFSASYDHIGHPISGYWDNNTYCRVIYSDVQNEYSGIGNINSNPMFVDNNHDFHLLGNSPCIDKGIPDEYYNDSDGSRNDMGAFGGTNTDNKLVLALDAEGNFLDGSIRSNNGIATNVNFVSVPWGGEAFYFDGSGYIEIPDIDNSLDLLNDFTIELLVKPLNDEHTSVIIGKADLNNYPKQFIIGYGGTVEPHTGYYTGCGPYTSGGSDPYLNLWKNQMDRTLA